MAVTTILTYQLDGTQKQFDVSFEYLSRSFVSLRLKASTGSLKDLKVVDDYKWISATRVELTDATIALDYEFLEIKRNTSTTQRIVNFQDGSILRATDLNTAELQPLHVAEEARDAAQLSISINPDGQMDAQQRRIVNMADGINPTDAVSKAQFDKATTDAQGFVTAASNSAGAANVSESNASRSASAALGSANAADASQKNAASSENNAAESARQSAASAKASQESNVNSQGAMNSANQYALNASNSASASSTSETNASKSAADALREANRSTTEADRAKAEADKISGQNILVDAIKSVDPTTHAVDFVAMPKVNGVEVTSALSSGGFQVNTKDVCEDGSDPDATMKHHLLDDNFWSGKTFIVKKGVLNSGKTNTLNHTPMGMEYDQAVCSDVYGTWTPTGQTGDKKSRVQTIWDKNALWIRGFHAETTTWTPWKRSTSQFYTAVDGMDLNTILEEGDYHFVTATNAPVISPEEVSTMYFLTVNSSDDRKEVVQVINSPKTNTVFTRYFVDNAWSRWWNSSATLDVDTAESGFDYDTVINPGYWGVDNANALHGPAGNTDKVIVQILGTADGSTIQTVSDTKEGKIYVRSRNLASGAWTEWGSVAILRGTGELNVGKITGLTGPLTLGGDGTGDYDAVTLRQVKSMTGSGTGASMSGVMNNFTGAVEWFNGGRGTVPNGYLPADGQLLNRADYPELWSAIDAGVFAKTTDALWISSGEGNTEAMSNATNRGKYSTGDGSLTFRMPDLNGGITGSIANAFLRGYSPAGDQSKIGSMALDGAPNITGNFASDMNGKSWFPFPSAAAYGAFYTDTPQANNSFKPLPGAFENTTNNARVNLDASKSFSGYGRSANEIRPRAAVGIWIVRVTGGFQATGTEFSVMNGDANQAATGVVVNGGKLTSVYSVGNTQKASASFESSWSTGATVTNASIIVDNKTGKTAKFDFTSNGGLNVPDTVTSAHFRSTGDNQFDGNTAFKAGVSVTGVIATSGGIDARYGYFNSSGNAGSNRQGCHIVWNERPAEAQWSGATSFVNNFGSGNGGFIFRNVNAANTTQRGEWQMFTGIGNSDRAGFICKAPNGSQSTFQSGGGSHSLEWITGSGVGQDGKPYLQFGFDGGSKGVNFFDSDIKFKEDVKDVEKGSALDTVEALRSVSFRWKGAPEGLRSPYGVIAQEVNEIIPEMIQIHDDGTMGIDPLNMIGLLLAAVKDLKAEVDELKANQK